MIQHKKKKNVSKRLIKFILSTCVHPYITEIHNIFLFLKYDLELEN